MSSEQIKLQFKSPIDRNFLEVANVIVGSRTVSIKGTEYIIEIPKGKSLEYEQLLKWIFSKGSEQIEGSKLDIQEILVYFSPNVSSELLDIFNLVYRTKTVREFRNLNIVQLALPTDVEVSSFVNWLYLSPLVRSVKSNPKMSTF